MPPSCPRSDAFVFKAPPNLGGNPLPDGLCCRPAKSLPPLLFLRASSDVGAAGDADRRFRRRGQLLKCLHGRPHPNLSDDGLDCSEILVAEESIIHGMVVLVPNVQGTIYLAELVEPKLVRARNMMTCGSVNKIGIIIN